MSEFTPLNQYLPSNIVVKSKHVGKYAFSAKEAEAKDKRGKNAEQASSNAEKRKSFLRRLLLIILSTSLNNDQRRIYHRTLLTCLENKKFCAYRKLGRSFLVPSMTSWTTWPSRRRQMMGNCSGSNVTPTSADSKNTLRSEQKMSGLFDTVQAGNTTVAGKASKPGPDMMESGLDLAHEAAYLAGLMTNEEDFDKILPDVEFGLMEGDYLDSFMDLSNFLLPKDSKGFIAVDPSIDNGTVNEKLDFSGVVSHLKAEPTVTTEVPDFPQPSVITSSPRKRKRVDYASMESDVVDVVDDSDMELGLECTVPDHDYVTKSKKPKLATIKCEAPAAADLISTFVVNQAATKPVPSTSTSKPTEKYRQRRDKNNEASRRSRQIRKQKYVEMDHESANLEIRNEELRQKIVKLEAMAKTMKAILIEKMT